MVVELVQPKIVLLSNSSSGYNSRSGTEAINRTAEKYCIPHYKAASWTEIEMALAVIAIERPDILAINGGDGTVDAVVNMMRTKQLFDPEPRLALIKGGTTNMIHGDCGLRGTPAQALKTLIDGKIISVPRRPLKIIPDNGCILYGFFLGTGAIPRVILRTRQTLHKWRISGKIGEALAVAVTLAQLRFRQDLSKDTVLYPSTITMKMDDKDKTTQFVFMAVTSLKRLILNRTIKTADENMGLIYMQTDRKVAQDSAKEIFIELTEPWVLDGEFFQPGRITVALDAPFDFLVDRSK